MAGTDNAKSVSFNQLKERLLQPKHLSRKDILKKQKHKAREARVHRLILHRSLARAGVTTKPEKFFVWIFRVALIINIFVAMFLLQRYAGYFAFSDVVYLPFLILAAWLAIFMFVFFVLWLGLYLTLDVISYRRKVMLEEVLPDFLLLTSANIRAGMPIDTALWYSVRPRFGVLSKEIELVAKETMTGQPLEVALRKFGDKYNSALLKNSVNLIIEGINAGGEIGDLLSKISASIQDNKLLKKEMAASISSYSIFIAASALFIAPVMFALASQLLTVVSSITSNIDIPTAGLTSFAFSPGGVGISQNDFLIFAVTNLLFTSLFSAMIVAIIRKGEIKAGIKNIPIFIIISLLVFFGAFKVFSGLFGELI